MEQDHFKEHLLTFKIEQDKARHHVQHPYSRSFICFSEQFISPLWSTYRVLFNFAFSCDHLVGGNHLVREHCQSVQFISWPHLREWWRTQEQFTLTTVAASGIKTTTKTKTTKMLMKKVFNCQIGLYIQIFFFFFFFLIFPYANLRARYLHAYILTCFIFLKVFTFLKVDNSATEYTKNYTLRTK